ncbi:unnamed protein product [Caenorhabditis bovis]|uniref:Calponin-homology (CH) domain-containing protein n=1 Tax=Caenorhabditis bovis TaxID=2654633 RepID=A0A8S1EQH0_9PELO|nr:unnamed protein product [Caenorhabditis bovis]
MDKKREAVLKKLSERHEKRVLQKLNSTVKNNSNIDISATEKAFLATDPSQLDMKTPVRNKAPPVHTFSPIVSFDEKANKQIVALAAWCNTILDIDDSEEIDMGSTKMEACRKIQEILKTKKTENLEVQPEPINRYPKIFDKNNSAKIRDACRKILIDSDIGKSIETLLSKRILSIRPECAVYSDLALQTSLLRIFLSFHPAYLKAALEAVFNRNIETSAKTLLSILSKFIISNVFSDAKLLKNKKYAQGCGKPIVTAAGKEALHNHFLSCAMKIFFLVETARINRIIPNVTRVFNKSSQFKSFDSIFVEFSKEILSGTSIPLKKAFARIGFISSYNQTFIDDYDYFARGFEDFSNGVILGKLVETIGNLKPGSILNRLRDPAGDRIRKLKNVEIVLDEMSKLGIVTENISAAQIVGSKKEAVLSILWSIIGVRVTADKSKINLIRDRFNHENISNKNPDEDISNAALILCREVGSTLGIEVKDLESVYSGELLAKAWNTWNPSGSRVEHYPGDTLWEKVTNLAESEMRIAKGIDQHLPLFIRLFMEGVQRIEVINRAARKIQKTWRAFKYNQSIPKLYKIVQQVVDSLPMIRNASPCEISSRLSCVSLCNATFTISRESTSSNCELDRTFKIPKTPARTGEAPRESIRLFEKVIEEDGEEDEEINENDENKHPDADETDFESSIAEELCRKLDVLDVDEQLAISNSETIRTESFYDNVTITADNYKQIEKNRIGQMSVFSTEESFQEREVNETNDANAKNICDSESQNICEKNKNDGADEVVQERSPVATNFDAVAEKFESVHAKEYSNFVEINCDDKDFLEPEQMEIDEESVVKEKINDISNYEYRDESTVFEDGSSLASESPRRLCVFSKENTFQDESKNEEIVENKEIAMENENIRESTASRDSESGAEVEDNVDLKLLNSDQLREILKRKLKLANEQKKMANKLDKLSLIKTFKQCAKVSKPMDVSKGESASSLHRTNAGMEVSSLTDDLNHAFACTPTANFDPIITDLQKCDEETREKAAIVIQKCIRGYFLRKRMETELRDMQTRVDNYNRIAELNRIEIKAAQKSSTVSHKDVTAVDRLRNYTLHGLTHCNLSLVNISATAILRIISLLPELVETFVNELDGISKICNILENADRGLSYTHISAALILILERIVVLTSIKNTHAKLKLHLEFLSPKLLHLMLVNSNNAVLFIALCRTLEAILQQWRNVEACYMKDAPYFIKKSKSKLKNADCLTALKDFENIYTVCTA